MTEMRVQSNGMGQQSVAMYYMSSMGVLPRLDYSIFADPGKEKKETYEYLESLDKWREENNGIPLIVDKSKNLYEDILSSQNSTGHRFASIPAFSESGGMIRRQCTNEYKIDVVNKAIREIQGKRPGQIFDPVEIWMGISLDEMHRMTTPHRKRVTFVYPFCGYKTLPDGSIIKLEGIEPMRRTDINAWMTEQGFSIPPKSSCVFCPFQNNQNWEDLRKNHPEDFKHAVKIDEAIRDMSKRGMNDKIFIHRSLKPLKEIDSFTGGQMDMFNTEGEDCFGYCGV